MRTNVAILPIRTLGDPVLREKARPVERFDEALKRLADDLFETMYHAPGVGLAAPQVGVSLRCFVYDDGEGGKGFLANPDLFDASGEQVTDEGCLSIPGPFFPTTRALEVRVRGQDLEGEQVVLEGHDLFARILQHETDHLDAMLYIDRLPADGRREVMRMLREHEFRGQGSLKPAPPPS